MRKKTRTEITIEVEQIMLIKSRRGAALAWCPTCAAEVMMVTPEQASALAQISLGAIHRWISTGQLHFAKTPGGLLLICLDSLREV